MSFLGLWQQQRRQQEDINYQRQLLTQYERSLDTTLAKEYSLRSERLLRKRHIIFEDTMEDLLKWTQTAGAITLDNTYAFHGSKSLKISGAGGVAARADRTFPMCKSRIVRMSFVWSIDDFSKLTSWSIGLLLYSGVRAYQLALRFNATTNFWQYADQNGTYINIPGSYNAVNYGAKTTVGGVWHSFKVYYDFKTSALLRFQVNEFFTESLSNPGWEYANATVRQSDVAITCDPSGANACNLWIDDFLLEEELTDTDDIAVRFDELG